MKKLFFGMLCTSLFLVSCKTQKVVAGHTSQISQEKLIKKISEESDFKQLRWKAKTHVDISDKNIPTLILTLYAEKNEQIYISGNVSLLSGVVKGLATPEKLQAYEKLNKTFIDEDYDYANELLGVNFLNYKALENLLLGKTFSPIHKDEIQLQINATNYTLTSTKPFEVTYKNREFSYWQTLVYDANFQLSEVLLQDKENQKELQITYSDRTEFQKLNLPTKVKIFLKDTKNKEITLEYSNFDDSEMDVNYQVPENYSPRKF